MIAPDDITFDYLEGRPGVAEGLRCRRRALARAAHRRRRRVRHRGHRRHRRRSARRSPGGRTPGQVVPVTGARPRPGGARRPRRPRGRRASARLHGARARHRDRGHRARPRLHRLLHELAHRGPARGRVGGRGPEGRRQRARDGRAGLAAGEGAGRAGGTRRGLQARRVRLARGRLLDVPRDEPGHPRSPGERCASTSNRNFEGRQGRGGRTHLVSPQMAAAAAIAGHFVDIREWE